MFIFVNSQPSTLPNLIPPPARLLPIFSPPPPANLSDFGNPLPPTPQTQTTTSPNSRFSFSPFSQVCPFVRLYPSLSRLFWWRIVGKERGGRAGTRLARGTAWLGLRAGYCR